MDNAQLVSIFKELPAYRPPILNILAEVIDEDGIIADKAESMAKEINQAAEETKEYISKVKEFKECLIRIRP